MGTPTEAMSPIRISTTNRMLPVLLLLASSAVLAARPKIFFQAGEQDIGIFYVGNHSLALAGQVNEQAVDYESFVGMLPAGKGQNHEFMLDHAFEIRSADFKFRAKVVVFKTHDNEMELTSFPYSIVFKNLMLERTEDGLNSKPMELKHSSSGYQWIESGHHFVQATGPHHPFELRNRDKQLMVTIQLDEYAEQDL